MSMIINPEFPLSPFPAEPPPGWCSCRVCGCWEYNACWWVGEDLCSHCHHALQERSNDENGPSDGQRGVHGKSLQGRFCGF